MNLTDIVLNFYLDFKPHTTQELYEYYENLAGESSDEIRHTLRGIQQNLAKQSLIKNVERGTWILNFVII